MRSRSFTRPTLRRRESDLLAALSASTSENLIAILSEDFFPGSAGDNPQSKDPLFACNDMEIARRSHEAAGENFPDGLATVPESARILRLHRLRMKTP